MHPPSSRNAAIALLTALFSLAAPASAETELRVCADPDNLPFSNRNQEGFENKIAALLADDLPAKLSFYWQKQRQGFIRETLGAGHCDVVMGVPHGYERVRATPPYYRSGYAFVTPAGRHLDISSFDDPRLHDLKIGLHAIGNDGANSPPAHALASRGIVENIVGYSMWGEETQENPQGEIVSAVANGEIDLAVVWGPIAGYFAKPYGNAIQVAPVPADSASPEMPFAFDIALGVRKDDQALADRLAASLTRKRPEIQAILAAYRVPIIQPIVGSTPSATDSVAANH